MTKEETHKFNDGRVESDTVEQYCFRSVYALNLLKGFGFQNEDFITAKKVINGHKVSWAIGAILYEINALPWEYQKLDSRPATTHHYEARGLDWVKYEFFCVVLLFIFAAFLYRQRQRHATSSKMYEYEPVKDVDQNVA